MFIKKHWKILIFDVPIKPEKNTMKHEEVYSAKPYSYIVTYYYVYALPDRNFEVYYLIY